MDRNLVVPVVNSRSWRWSLVLLAVSLAALLALWPARLPDPVPGPAALEIRAVPTRSPIERTVPVPTTPVTAAAPQRPGEPSPPSAPAASDLQPELSAESDWMAQHGFPDRDQLQRYLTLSVPELQHAAAAGDTMALAFLGERRLRTPDSLQGLEDLRTAAAHGSILALHTLARHYFELARSLKELHGNQVVHNIGLSYLVAAALLGDTMSWRVATDFARKQHPDQPQRAAAALQSAFRMATEQVHRLRLQRLQLGLGDFPVEPPRRLLPVPGQGS